MTPANMQFFCGFVRKRSGLVLSEDKNYLIESRLNPIARKLGLNSLDAVAEALRAGRSISLETAVIEAMTTNESSFFRDRAPFERLKGSILPKLMAARSESRRLNIWCAATSTGQEPYSLAIMFKELEAQLKGWKIDILATDISSAVLEKAKAGLSTQFGVQRGLPIQVLVKHFTQEGERWRIDPSLRAMVRFRQYNLLEDFSSLGTFDIIFCRNVLIYFDRELKSNILDRLPKVMAQDCALFLGAAETLIGLTDGFRLVPGERAIYEPSESDQHDMIQRKATG